MRFTRNQQSRITLRIPKEPQSRVSAAVLLLFRFLQSIAVPPKSTVLDYEQLEVLCQEHLRETGQLKHLLTPIGRNMYEVDICGMAHDSALLLAQVTHTDDPGQTADKAKRLAAFAGRNRKLIYFGPASTQPNDARLTFISIEDVFVRMMKENRTLIEMMLKADWANNGTEPIR